MNHEQLTKQADEVFNGLKGIEVTKTPSIGIGDNDDDGNNDCAYASLLNSIGIQPNELCLVILANGEQMLSVFRLPCPNEMQMYRMSMEGVDLHTLFVFGCDGAESTPLTLKQLGIKSIAKIRTPN